MDKIFDHLKEIFNKNGFNFYMIGSSSRDYLLGKDIEDYDFVTNATPDEIKSFLNVSTTFKKYGVVKYKLDGFNVDIATLRKEKNYLDNRHPNKIEFVNTIEEDYVRRDFTINAIYINEKYEIIDPTNQGVDDLNNKILRFIGDPLKRIEEDPLRILRAKRFMLKYNLTTDENTLKILKENENLLSLLNPDKVKEELNKLNK